VKQLLRKIFLVIPYLLLFFILSVSISAPLLEYKRIEFSQHLYQILHYICNQLSTRCLFVYTSPMALCSRCFFIYLTMFATGLIFLLTRKKRIYWKTGLILMIPCILDGSSQYLGFRMSNNVWRSITGGLAGAGIGLIFFPLYFRLVNFILRRR